MEKDVIVSYWEQDINDFAIDQYYETTKIQYVDIPHIEIETFSCWSERQPDMCIDIDF